jgi:hypothetical protein
VPRPYLSCVGTSSACPSRLHLVFQPRAATGRRARRQPPSIRRHGARPEENETTRSSRTSCCTSSAASRRKSAAGAPPKQGDSAAAAPGQRKKKAYCLASKPLENFVTFLLFLCLASFTNKTLDLLGSFKQIQSKPFFRCNPVLLSFHEHYLLCLRILVC